jgi:hypothetical protein
MEDSGWRTRLCLDWLGGKAGSLSRPPAAPLNTTHYYPLSSILYPLSSILYPLPFLPFLAVSERQ